MYPLDDTDFVRLIVAIVGTNIGQYGSDWQGMVKLLFVFSLIAAKTPDAFSEKNATSLLVLGTAQKAALPTVLEDKEVFAAQCQW